MSNPPPPPHFPQSPRPTGDSAIYDDSDSDLERDQESDSNEESESESESDSDSESTMATQSAIHRPLHETLGAYRGSGWNGDEESTRNISPPTRAVKVQALKVGRPGTSSRTRVSAQSLRNVMTDSMKEHLIASTKKLSIGKQPTRTALKKIPNRSLAPKPALKDTQSMEWNATSQPKVPATPCSIDDGPDIPRLARSGTDGSDITIKAAEQPMILDLNHLQPPIGPTSRRGSTDSTSTEGSLPYMTDPDIVYSSDSDAEANTVSSVILRRKRSQEQQRLSQTVFMSFAPGSGIRQHAGSDRGSPGGYASPGSSPSGNSGFNRGVRHGSSGDGPGENNDNDDRRKRPRKDDSSNGRRGSEDNGRRLACPYYRFDPTNPEHMRCKDKSFPTLARVKGHVLRAHLKPKQCERCCLFRAGDRGQISNHLRGGNCEKAEEFVPIDPEIEKKGNELSRQGCSKTWEQVCMVLFDCTLEEVPTAYMDEPLPAMSNLQTPSPSTSATNLLDDPQFVELLHERFTAFTNQMFLQFMNQEAPGIIARYQELNSKHQTFLENNSSPATFSANAAQFLAPNYGSGCNTVKSPPTPSSNAGSTPAASPATQPAMTATFQAPQPFPSPSDITSSVSPSTCAQARAPMFSDPFANIVAQRQQAQQTQRPQEQQQQAPLDSAPPGTVDPFRLSFEDDRSSTGFSEFGMDLTDYSPAQQPLGGEEFWDIHQDMEAGIFGDVGLWNMNTEATRRDQML